MARYLIDTDDGRDFVPGNSENALDCPYEARALAQRVLGAMTDNVMPGGDHRVFLATVRDEAGQEIYVATVTFVGEWKVPLVA